MATKANDTKCPKCKKKGTLLYVQRVYEYHRMETIPDAEGYCDLNALEDSLVDDSFEPYLLCEKCHAEFDLNLNLKPRVKD
jgi:hypothetical protein